MSKNVSFSQFSTYLRCPHKWELDYIQRRRHYEPSIHTCFGTAFHNTIQTYLKVMYTESLKKANEINLFTMLKDEMVAEYTLNVEKSGQHFSSQQELLEFHSDGVAILQHFIRKRAAYFSTKNYELVGIEMPLELDIRSNLRFLAYLDIVIRDKRDKSIHIIDFKTSTRGWSSEKKDISKTSQLILYKKYYSNLYKVDIDKITVEFLIVRRKINEDMEYPPKRLQSFKPACGSVTVKKVTKLFDNFIDTSFDKFGEYIIDKTYQAIENKNCQYCEYSKSTALCPVGGRIRNGSK